MSSHNGNGGRGNPWGSDGSNSNPPDLETLVRQGQDRFKQILPGGNIDAVQTSGTRR